MCSSRAVSKLFSWRTHKKTVVITALVLIMLSLTLIALLLAFVSFGHSEGRQVEVTHEVTFDLRVGRRNVGSVTMALFGTIAPKTVKNFATLADPQGFNGYSYRNSKFHRVIPRFMIQV